MMMYRHNRHRNEEQREEVKEAQVNETEASLEAIYRDEANHMDATRVLQLVDLGDIVEFIATEDNQQNQ